MWNCRISCTRCWRKLKVSWRQRSWPAVNIRDSTESYQGVFELSWSQKHVWLKWVLFMIILVGKPWKTMEHHALSAAKQWWQCCLASSFAKHFSQASFLNQFERVYSQVDARSLNWPPLVGAKTARDSSGMKQLLDVLGRKGRSTCECQVRHQAAPTWNCPRILQCWTTPLEAWVEGRFFLFPTSMEMWRQPATRNASQIPK